MLKKKVGRIRVNIDVLPFLAFLAETNNALFANLMYITATAAFAFIYLT